MNISRYMLAVLFCLTSAGVVFADDKGIGHYLKGLDALEKSNFAAAAQAFTEAIDADEENADYRTARGVAYALCEQLEKALSDLQRANRLRPNHTPTRLWLATTMGMQGRFREDVLVYPAATRDPYETAVREMSRKYGNPAFRRITLRQAALDQDWKQQGQAKRQFAKLARQFVQRAKPAGSAVGAALKKRGLDKLRKGQYVPALDDLRNSRKNDPTDEMVILGCAFCKLEIGAFEGAREDFTIVLTKRDKWALGYIGRSLAHAAQGSATLAHRDFAIAESLDSIKAAPYKSRLQKQIAKIQPSSTPAQRAQMLNDLQQAAKEGHSPNELLAKATVLVKSVHADRLRADETYQRGLQKLRRAAGDIPQHSQQVDAVNQTIGAQPVDEDKGELPQNKSRADSFAALGEFLYQNAVAVLIEWVEPRAEPKPYRHQTIQTQKLELAEAERALDAALAIDPLHARAMAFKAACLMQRLAWRQAEKLLERAIEIHPHDAVVLEMVARVLDHAAAVKSAAASNLRSVDSWSDHQYIYFRYPSRAERQAADQYDAQARRLWGLAKDALEGAAEVEKGAALGYYYQAILAQRGRDLPAARTALEQAVAMKKDYLDAWRRLIQVYAALKLRDEMYHAKHTAANLSHTTAGPMLKMAWLKINRTAYKSARAALDRAALTDPADARVAAYRGVIAREEEQPADAAGWFAAAAVIAQAQGVLMGLDLDRHDGPPLDPNQIGRMVMLNYLAGESAYRHQKPKLAIDFLQANVNLFGRIERADRYRPIASAMLPETLKSHSIMPQAPNLETLLAWTRLRLGESLVAVGGKNRAQLQQAAEHFQWVMNFERRKPSVLDVGELIRTPAKLANIQLVKLALAQGDTNAARRYLMFVGRPRFLSPEATAELNALRQQVQQGRVQPNTTIRIPQQFGRQPRNHTGHRGQTPGARNLPANYAQIRRLTRLIQQLEQTLQRPGLPPNTRQAIELGLKKYRSQLKNAQTPR